MYRRPITILLSLLFATSAFAASALDPFLATVKRTKLPNGVTVITRETPGTGVVAVNTWVRAGFFDETDEVSGMAHVFEHMLFKSTKHFPRVGQIADEIASAGGTLNAGTSYEYTTYEYEVTKEGFRRALELQADALANPVFDETELRKEIEVIIEESNRKRDTPPRMAQELMYAEAFRQHRMKRWRIGSEQVLRNLKRADLIAFYETLYQPENMILVVTGDVPHDEVMKVVQQTYARIPKRKPVKSRGPAEPPQKELRYGQASADTRQGFTTLGWHTVGASHADAAALDVLSTILGSGRASRLYRYVVDPSAASTVSAIHLAFGEHGLLEIQTSFEEKNRAEADRRLLREIERIRISAPTTAEVQLARNMTESNLIFALEDVLGQAGALGQAELAGGYQRLGTDLAAMNAVTPAAVQRVAQKYLTVDNMTVFHYRPKGTPEQTREQVLAFVRDAMSNVTPAAAENATVPADAKPFRGARGTPAPVISKLANGATLIVEERTGAPVVSAGVYFRGGRNAEHSANAGITRLMGAVMRRGTTSRPPDQLSRELAFLGAQVALDLSRDYFGYTVDVLSRNARPAVALLSDIVLQPSFLAESIAQEKDQQKASMRRNADHPVTRPQHLLYEAMYRNHPYALSLEGYATSVDSLTADALREWWRSNVAAEDALLLVAGDIHADDAKQLIESAFAALPKRGTPRVPPALPLVAVGRTDAVEYRDKKQSTIAIGFPAVGFAHADYAPLRLLQEITSGISGTLFTELRSKRSLAYTVNSSIQPAEQGGAYVAYIGSEAAKEADARSMLLSELRRHAVDAISEEHLARAKSALAGSIRLQRQANRALVSEAARNHFLGLGTDFTERFIAAAQKQTLDDVKKAAGRYLGGDNYVTAIVRGKS